MIRPTGQFRAIFNGTTVPVLEQVVNFDEARQALLAGNIANFDTPLYQARDLDVGTFKHKLALAIERKNKPPGAFGPDYPLKNGRSSAQGVIWPVDHQILYHDLNNVGMEFQVTEMAKNNMEFNTALNIMRHQMLLLQTAISERV
ncbi:MAG: flagellar basal body rod protein FlgB [Planctomycetaceae bacterium]|jgi:flagellar basal-body rod protein FlgB|nr:flagellar basal body rod protein FlgB [Planctomycetaceae bacterium]